MSALPESFGEQVGGDHYKSCPIQPVEYIQANDLCFEAGNVLKYITRAGRKPGADPREDILKARHYLELWLRRFPEEEE